ncbi:MAG: 6-hydroxynicotinate reductase [Alphaproteobacteria bacterium]|nr:6-hydroxynicotinate reductase [Alphaproteobacteria bacterium]
MLTQEKIRCDACPVMCFIADGKSGACDRYANENGEIIRLDPLVILNNQIEKGEQVKPFLKADWNGETTENDNTFITAIGSGTTYPDYKPAPFIFNSKVDGADFITVVTEAIFSYCGVKIKIDTDRHLGSERAIVRHKGEAIGHVMTSEYGSQMLSLGGVDHLTGGTKVEGRVTCEALMNLCNKEAIELSIDEGLTVIVQAGKPPIIEGIEETKMRVGCGSATIGMFASQWFGLVDEVVVVDDHITGVVSEHQAGKVLDWKSTGISVKGRRSTPGRYFQVANPGTGWGGTDIQDPLTILGTWNEKKGAVPGLTILMVSTTGENYSYYELDNELIPKKKKLPANLKSSVELIKENCEPALCTVMFVGGAGGSLRSGVTKNPIQLTKSVKNNETNITCGGAKTYIWPGGGITLMVDVHEMPDNSFGYVPTPAIVAPLEFTIDRNKYKSIGGHTTKIRSKKDIIENGGEYGNKKSFLS